MRSKADVEAKDKVRVKSGREGWSGRVVEAGRGREERRYGRRSRARRLSRSCPGHVRSRSWRKRFYARAPREDAKARGLKPYDLEGSALHMIRAEERLDRSLAHRCPLLASS